MGLVVCLVGTAPARASQTVNTTLTGGSRLDDTSENPPTDNSWTHWVRPDVSWSRRGPMVRWDAGVGRRFDSAPGARSPRPALDLGRAHLSAGQAGQVRMRLDGRYWRTRDPLSLAPGSVLPAGATEHAQGEARWEAPRLEAGWRGASRSQTLGRDGSFHDAEVTLLPVRGATNSVVLRGRMGLWAVDEREALRSTAALAGLRRAHTPALSSEAEVGVAQVRESDGSTSSGVAWSAGVTGLAAALGLPLNSRFHIRHEAETTGDAALGRSFGSLAVEARWSRALEVEGGSFTGPTSRDVVGLSVRDTLASRTVVALEGSAGRVRSRLGGERKEVLRASASVERPILDWLRGRAACEYFRQRSYTAAPVDDQRRTRIEVSLVAALPGGGSW